MTIDYSKLKEAYLSEAKALVNTMNQALIGLEKHPSNAKYFQEIFRAIHTLKTLSASMNYHQTMTLCHALEDLLEEIKKSKIKLLDSADLLFSCFDYLHANFESLVKTDQELDSSLHIEQLKNGEMEKNSSGENDNLLKSKVVLINEEKLKAIEVKVERLDILMNLAEELLVHKMRFDAIREQSEQPELNAAVESLGRVITDLQYHVMQIRLVSINFIFNRFLRMTRDLAKQQHKLINLEIEGGDIELDRMLIDELGESLGHLIRNAIDHGLETPEERKKRNKPAEGTIRLKAIRSKQTAHIEVSDDGRGLDLSNIKNLAQKRQLLQHSANTEDVIDVIFSGLSTKKVVTTISGRGLGLPIVKQKIESIGGTIKVKSIPEKGTTFIIEIPLTLAIIKTLFVKILNETYAIPLDAVDRLLVLNPEEFKGLLNFEAIIFENKEIPVIRISTLFGNTQQNNDKQSVVIIRKGDEQIGLVVDSLLSTQEVVIKPLSRALKNNQFFSGAALIGSGQMVLIFDVASLLKSKKVKQSQFS